MTGDGNGPWGGVNIHAAQK